MKSYFIIHGQLIIYVYFLKVFIIYGCWFIFFLISITRDDISPFWWFWSVGKIIQPAFHTDLSNERMWKIMHINTKSRRPRLRYVVGWEKMKPIFETKHHFWYSVCFDFLTLIRLHFSGVVLSGMGRVKGEIDTLPSFVFQKKN